MWFRYVLGAVETFLKAVPAAGIFRGNDGSLVPFDRKIFCNIFEVFYYNLVGKNNRRDTL